MNIDKKKTDMSGINSCSKKNTMLKMKKEEVFMKKCLLNKG